MSIKRNVRSIAIALIGLGGMFAPTSASATPEDVRECYHNCYIAYVVMTQQPAFYQQCILPCDDLY